MILTTIEEIDAYLPTNRWKNAESLLSVIEEEEENYLVPVLGRELFRSIEEKYTKLLEDNGGITPEFIPKADITVRLIRTCQKAVLFFALANNSGLLAVSLNPGGGMNQMGADGYDPADDKSVARFERDTWKKAHRNIDALLAMLEEDAQSNEPKFADLWKKSQYFYLKEGLLFSTAVLMDEYLSIEGSRERFIKLVPDIRYCQDVYLRPQVGDELMNAFIDTVTANDVIPTDAPDSSKPSDSEGTSSPTPDNEKMKSWRTALSRLRMALALYVENRQPKMRRPESLDEANMAIARALAFIRYRQDDFLPYIKSSPLYTPPPSEAEKPKSDETPMFSYDPNDPNNAVLAMPTVRRY